MLQFWSDDEIGTGEDAEKKIQDALENACVAILLVSPSSLSKVLKKQLADLLTLKDKEGLRIFPIIATDCNWEKIDWLRRMQVRPRDRKPLQSKTASQKATELKNLVSEVAEIVGKAVSSSMPDRSESPIEHPDIANPMAKKASSVDIKAQLQEVKARLERQMRDSAATLQDLEKQISALESAAGSGGAQTSATASGYRESPSKIPDQTPLPTGKVYEKRDAN